MSISNDFTKFIIETKFRDIPLETVKFTKVLTSKQVASMVAGSVAPTCKKIIKYVRERDGRPEAGVIGCGFTTSVENAALANGFLAHASELEDDQFPGGGISDVTIWPTIIPLAQYLKLSGREFIEAVFVGMEVQNRLAYYASVGTNHMGIMGLTFFGIFGAVAASCKALELNFEQTKAALGIGMAQAIGYMQTTGTDTHFYESATVNRNAITVAMLAKEGMTSNPDFERWLNTFCGKGVIELDKITKGIGEPPLWIHNQWVKKYPACFFTHRQADAFQTLVQENSIILDQIESVTVDVGPCENMCNRPYPSTPEDSRFSYHHVFAAMLLDGDVGEDTFTHEKLEDPRFVEARSKVTVRVHEDWPQRYMSPHCPVEVTLKDGRKFSRTNEYTTGCPPMPLTDEQVANIYRKFCKGILADAQIKQTFDVIMNLDKENDILELMHILTYRYAA